jgi:hypothetical protein
MNYENIDNIVVSKTPSDDQWVESADRNGKPMAQEEINALTNEQHYELILKSRGILQ